MIFLVLLSICLTVVVRPDVNIFECYNVEGVLDCTDDGSKFFRGEVSESITEITFSNIRTYEQLQHVNFKFNGTSIILKDSNPDLCVHFPGQTVIINGEKCEVSSFSCNIYIVTSLLLSNVSRSPHAWVT